MNNEPRPEPWYRDGLRFSCTRCGACCTGAPGFVWVELDEIERLATDRGESVDDFSRRHVRRVGRGYSLVEKPNGDCVFWSRETGCTVYQARPNQCRTWPFWRENIETPDDWRGVRRTCPGAGKGRLHSADVIEAAALHSIEPKPTGVS